MLKVLFLLPQKPYPWWYYGRSSYYFLLKSLIGEYKITPIVTFPFSEISGEELSHIRELGVIAYPQLKDTKDSFKNIIGNIGKEKPFKFLKYYNKGYLDFIDSLIYVEKPDIIQIHTPHMAQYGFYIKEKYPNIPIIVRMQDIVSMQIKTYIIGNNDVLRKIIASWQLRKTYRSEVNVFRFFDAIVFITKSDLKYAVEMIESLNVSIPRGKLITIEDGVEIKDNLYLKNSNKVNAIAFAGSSQIQNVISLKWFVKKIWRRVYRKSSLEFHIYGSVCRKFKRNNPYKKKRIFLKGFVKDRDKLDLVLSQYKAFISPTIVGSGYRTKILEAASIGLPIITTQFDANSFTYLKSELMIFNDEKEFQEIVATKLSDKNQSDLNEISKRLHYLVKKHYLWRNAAEKFVELYNGLLSRKECKYKSTMKNY